MARKNIDACFSSETDNWRTPKFIYDYFIYELNCIDTFEYNSLQNEFEIDRGRNLKLFCNPPFSKLKDIPKWIKHNFCDLNNEIYLLIPARTDTKYFHEMIQLKPFIYFIKGRLKYNDVDKSAPFPTILLHFTKEDIPYSYAPLDFNV